jgi:hypothetical protein
VVMGPFRPSAGDSILTGATLDFGELSSADLATPARWSASVVLRAGKTAYAVTEGNTPDAAFANGTFDADLSSWTVTGGAWAWNALGVARASAAGNLTQFAPVPFATYRVEFTLARRTAGSITVTMGGVTLNTALSTVGTYLQYVTTSTAATLTFAATAGCDLDIDNVSVQRVTANMASVTFTRDRRTKTLTHRLRGQWFSVWILNNTTDTYFSFDGGELEFETAAGKNRRQR